MNDLVEQRDVLAAHVANTRTYMATPEFNNLPTPERQLWQRQTVLIAELVQVLTERINLGVSERLDLGVSV